MSITIYYHIADGIVKKNKKRVLIDRVIGAGFDLKLLNLMALTLRGIKSSFDIGG